MKTISILSGRCLLLELPEHEDIEKELGIHGHDEGLTESEFKDYVIGLCPEGNWQIVGRLSEITEVQAAELVKYRVRTTIQQGKLASKMIWRNYTTNIYGGITALESLDSAIRATGHYLDINPYGSKRPSINDYSSLVQYQGDAKDFDEAQSRVLDRSRCLLLRRTEK